MPKQAFTILSTASIPPDRIPQMPETVKLDIVPFIEIHPRQDEPLKKKISILQTQKATVVFTSAQAVKAVTSLLTQKPDWTIYAIRHETGIALNKWFGEAYVLHTADNAQSLSALMLSDQVQEAFFFCGDQRLDILPDQMKKHGVQLHEFIVYDTRLTPVRIVKQPDSILFFSPSAVKSYFSLNTLTPPVLIFAMGKTTAAALKNFTHLPVILSPEADKTFVVHMALDCAGLHPMI